MHTKTLMLPLLGAVALILSACGTVAHGRFQEVPITSDPSGAHVTVDCGKGVKDAGVTPTIVQLRRKSDRCLVAIAKDGYDEKTLVFKRGLSGWVWGNVFLPYAIPTFLIDLGTGGAYKQHPYRGSVVLDEAALR